MATGKSAWQRSANQISEGMCSRFSPAVFVGYIKPFATEMESQPLPKEGQNGSHDTWSTAAQPLLLPDQACLATRETLKKREGGVKSARLSLTYERAFEDRYMGEFRTHGSNAHRERTRGAVQAESAE